MIDFIVWCPEYGQEQEDGMHIVDAYDYAEAAKQWANRYEQAEADYPIGNGECVEVLVLRLGQEPARAFIVSGEPRPYYFAREASE